MPAPKIAALNAWIRRRIFPGAYPPSLSEMAELLEPWRFTVLDVENLLYILAGLAVMYVFVAVLGVHAGMVYFNTRNAVGVSLATVIALVAVERVQRPDPLLALADQVSMSPDYQVINHKRVKLMTALIGPHIGQRAPEVVPTATASVGPFVNGHRDTPGFERRDAGQLASARQSRPWPAVRSQPYAVDRTSYYYNARACR